MTEQPLTLTPAEAASLLGVSRDLVYEQLHQGVIPCRRLGGRILIPRRALEEWLEGRDSTKGTSK